MKKARFSAKKALMIAVTGGIVFSQFASANGCLPNNYFAGLGGTLIELVATTIVADALANQLTPPQQG